MRLIDADALERVLMAMPDDELCDACCYNVMTKLDEQPTVDTVAVVQCKDCKWLGIGAEGNGTKLMICIKKHHDTTEEDYCSEGVNREDDPSD